MSQYYNDTIKEFDIYRAKREPHPLMIKNGVDAIPYQHKDIEIWRDNFKGLQYHHKEVNFIITGAIDDVWVKPDGELLIVDYKSTSTKGEITLDDQWKESYKRQMEIYQWLMRQMGFKVSDTGYFVYANGRKDLDRFNGKLLFQMTLLSHTGSDNWVERAVIDAHRCLMGKELPLPGGKCEYCEYRRVSAKKEYQVC